MKEFKINLDCDKNTFKLMVLGDLHIGDPLCDIDLIKETLDFVKKTNPDMTIEKLVDRLGICNYEWKTLNIVKGK